MNQEYLKAIKATYNAHTWMEKVDIKKMSRRYMPNHTLLDEFELEKRRAIPNARHQFIDYFQHKTDKDVRLAISVSEFETVEDAHNSMIHTLCHCTAPKLPLGEEVGLKVGDISFGGHSTIQTSTFFTRNNVFIKVESVGKKDYRVNEIALLIDNEIIKNLE